MDKLFLPAFKSIVNNKLIENSVFSNISKKQLSILLDKYGYNSNEKLDFEKTFKENLDETINFLNNFDSIKIINELDEKQLKEKGHIELFNLKNKNFAVNLEVFKLNENSDLGLHDHPNMFVYSKCLDGEISIISFNGTSSKAEITSRRTLKANESTMLFPSINNFHYIYSKNGGILLDFFLPYYDEINICNFYYIEDLESEKDSVFFKLNLI